jgi:hypothetical protein
MAMNGSGKVIKTLALVSLVLVGIVAGSGRALAQGENPTIYVQTGGMDHFDQYLFALEQMEAAFAASYAEEAAAKSGDLFEQLFEQHRLVVEELAGSFATPAMADSGDPFEQHRLVVEELAATGGSGTYFAQYLAALEEMEAAYAASLSGPYANPAMTDGGRFEQYLTALEQEETSRQLALNPATTGSPKVLLARLSERGDTVSRFEQYQQAIELMEQEIGEALSGR